MSKIQVFASYDRQHDRSGYGRLVAHAKRADSCFLVSSGSVPYSASDEWSAQAREKICEADQVIVICGEHTEASAGVFAELKIAREEKKPYFLLWGEPEAMCTKPPGAKSTEGIYRWTLENVHDQLHQGARSATLELRASEMKRARAHRTS